MKERHHIHIIIYIYSTDPVVYAHIISSLHLSYLSHTTHTKFPPKLTWRPSSDVMHRQQEEEMINIWPMVIVIIVGSTYVYNDHNIWQWIAPYPFLQSWDEGIEGISHEKFFIPKSNIFLGTGRMRRWMLNVMLSDNSTTSYMSMNTIYVGWSLLVPTLHLSKVAKNRPLRAKVQLIDT
jgi:hypothetical protein